MKTLKDGEVAVNQNDFGILVETFVRDCLKRNNDAEWFERHLRAWWPQVEDYYHRQIICDIEVELHMDEPLRPNHRPLNNKEMWKKLAKELRDPRSEFTVDYRCDKCKTGNVKLWRGVHACPDKDGSKLLCASCLAPGVEVDDEGRWQDADYPTGDGKFIPGHRTDQVKGWLPAVPVGDTFWGYGSVPSQDVEWWDGLPTYQKESCPVLPKKS